MHDSSARILWHTANWLALGAMLRFRRGRIRQRSGNTAGSIRNRLLPLADDIILHQLALRNHIINEHALADPAGYWAPVIILYQQTGDLLHELHQHILELSPVRFAPVVPALDIQLRAFRAGGDDLEQRLNTYSENADKLIRDMNNLRSGLQSILSTGT
ncbi:MAG: hypothetical protein ACNA8K_00480 [Cyclonatronaceae bacterium]